MLCTIFCGMFCRSAAMAIGHGTSNSSFKGSQVERESGLDACKGMSRHAPRRLAEKLGAGGKRQDLVPQYILQGCAVKALGHGACRVCHGESGCSGGGWEATFTARREAGGVQKAHRRGMACACAGVCVCYATTAGRGWCRSRTHDIVVTTTMQRDREQVGFGPLSGTGRRQARPAPMHLHPLLRTER